MHDTCLLVRCTPGLAEQHTRERSWKANAMGRASCALQRGTLCTTANGRIASGMGRASSPLTKLKSASTKVSIYTSPTVQSLMFRHLQSWWTKPQKAKLGVIVSLQATSSIKVGSGLCQQAAIEDLSCMQPHLTL